MDNKRLVVWILATAASCLLLLYVRSLFFPPEPTPLPEETKTVYRKLRPEEERAAQASALRLFSDSFTRGYFPTPSPLAELQTQRERQRDLYREFERQRLVILPFDLPQKWQEELLKEYPRQRMSRSQAAMAAQTPDKAIILGTDQTKLKVELSENHGGGVRSIVLNKHQSATKNYGLKEGNKLQLISWNTPDFQGEEEEKQSFRVLMGNEKMVWQLEKGHTSEQASFVAEVPGKPLLVRKTFKLDPQSYHLDLTLTFIPKEGTTKAIETTYELTGPRNMPVEAMKWQQRPFRYLVTCVAKPGDPNKPIRYLEDHNKLVKEELPPRSLTDPTAPTNLVYAGVMLPYFSSVIVVDREPNQDQPPLIERVIYEDLGKDPQAEEWQEKVQGRVSLRLAARSFAVEAGKPVTHRYLLYAGPTKPLLLNYELETTPGLADRYIKVYHLNTLTDYQWFDLTGRLGLTTIFVFFTNLMHWLLETLSGFLGYGGAIILMTVIVRLLLHPISRKQLQSSQEMSAKMAKLRPELAKVQEKFKNDPQARSMAQWELVKKHGVNPFSSCTGCLVMLIQMPIFMGLYYALNESMHLRLASFLWMDNLAAPDMLLNWSNWPVLGWLGRGFTIFGMWIHLGDYLHILPLISVTLMYIHQKKVAPPAMDEQQAMQMKMMNYMMFVFAYMFYWVPSGLCLYFIVSSGWGLLERKFMPKKPTDDLTEGVLAKEERKETKATKEGKGNNKDGKTEAPLSLKDKLTAWWEKLLKEADKRR